jgi:hypothetical protein
MKPARFGKRAAMALALVVTLAVWSTPVRSDDLAPPPWRGAPGSTFQHWHWDNGDTQTPDVWNNPYGIPQENSAERNNAWWNGTFGGRQGVITLAEGYMEWHIPNHFEPTIPKWVRIQLTLNTPNFNWVGNPTVGPVTQLETDPATQITWYHHWADYVIPCRPFDVFVTGTFAMDQLVVDTVCVPEPGSMLLSSIGLGVVGLVARRRRKA